jgi:large subunit ribosomal protein L32
MGAVPKHRISKSRRNKRRTHHAIKLKTLVECPNCRAKKLPHHVCLECGTYRGVQVLAV